MSGGLITSLWPHVEWILNSGFGNNPYPYTLDVAHAIVTAMSVFSNPTAKSLPLLHALLAYFVTAFGSFFKTKTKSHFTSFPK